MSYKIYISFNTFFIRYLNTLSDYMFTGNKIIKASILIHFFVSLFAVIMVGDLLDKFQKSWWLTLLYILVVTLVIMLFNVIWAFYSAFFHFRKTEREIRKLIYQDLLERMSKEK